MLPSTQVKQYTQTDRNRHFLRRLKERADVDMTMDELKELYAKPHGFQGVYSISEYHSFGYIKVKGKKVYVIYNSAYHTYLSVTDQNVCNDLDLAMDALFRKKDAHKTACIHQIARKLQAELDTVTEKETRKDTALFYKGHPVFSSIMTKFYGSNKPDAGVIQLIRAAVDLYRINPEYLDSTEELQYKVRPSDEITAEALDSLDFKFIPEQSTETKQIWRSPNNLELELNDLLKDDYNCGKLSFISDNEQRLPISFKVNSFNALRSAIRNFNGIK